MPSYQVAIFVKHYGTSVYYLGHFFAQGDTYGANADFFWNALRSANMSNGPVYEVNQAVSLDKYSEAIQAHHVIYFYDSSNYEGLITRVKEALGNANMPDSSALCGKWLSRYLNSLQKPDYWVDAPADTTVEEHRVAKSDIIPIEDM
ncbi:hypothetical protein GGI21_001429 [Coemansia aciculifera]|nr:hypothetical protein GGI21_001429 [Coemansia aciculifera]